MFYIFKRKQRKHEHNGERDGRYKKDPNESSRDED